MRSKNHLPKATFETVWATLQETAQLMKENERERKEYEQRRKEQFAEDEQRRKEEFAKDEQRKKEAEQRRKEDEQRRKEDEQRRKEDEQRRKEAEQRSDKEWEKFWNSMKATREDTEALKESTKAMQQELGGIGNSNGAVAESYFVNSFTNSMQFAGQEYDSMDHHSRRSSKKLNLKGEYDLVLYNCTSVVIVEVKYNARQKDVEKLLKKAPVFKQLFPQYADFDLYLGLAAFHFEEHTESSAMENGIAIIKQIGENMVIYDEHLKVF